MKARFQYFAPDQTFWKPSLFVHGVSSTYIALYAEIKLTLHGMFNFYALVIIIGFSHLLDLQQNQ